MKILTVVGARPQFIKASAVSRAIASTAAVTEVIVHTGQHYDARMSDVFFEELGLPSAEHLGVGSGPHGEQTGEMMKRLEPVVVAEKADLLLTYGDTNSTLAAALVGAKCGLPVAHVEAGLRSFNRQMPEETNRVVTDHVSTWLFCPSDAALSNLADEGIRRGVHFVGDVMFDVLRLCTATLPAENVVADQIGVDGPYVLVTVHRAGNTDDPNRFDSIVVGIRDLADRGWDVIWPVHPRVRPLVANRDLPRSVHLVEPASYIEMLALQRGATVIATDSGGVQKEAYWLGVPCLTLRSETEWVETLATGWNRLVGNRLWRLADEVDEVRQVVSAKVPRPALYGDGDAAHRIIDVLTIGEKVAR